MRTHENLSEPAVLVDPVIVLRTSRPGDFSAATLALDEARIPWRSSQDGLMRLAGEVRPGADSAFVLEVDGERSERAFTIIEGLGLGNELGPELLAGHTPRPWTSKAGVVIATAMISGLVLLFGYALAVALRWLP